MENGWFKWELNVIDNNTTTAQDAVNDGGVTDAALQIYTRPHEPRKLVYPSDGTYFVLILNSSVINILTKSSFIRLLLYKLSWYKIKPLTVINK